MTPAFCVSLGRITPIQAYFILHNENSDIYDKSREMSRRNLYIAIRLCKNFSRIVTDIWILVGTLRTFAPEDFVPFPNQSPNSVGMPFTDARFAGGFQMGVLKIAGNCMVKLEYKTS